MPAVRSGSDKRPFAEINVTPFVDVVLVLLIIFMVTAPMMQQGVDVDLPNTTTQNLRVHNEPLIITVKKDGSYFLANTQVSEKDLGPKLQAILTKTLKDSIADVATVTQQVERIEKLHAERRTMRAVMIYRMNLVLTPEQRGKLEAFHKRRDENRRRQPDSKTERRN